MPRHLALLLLAASLGASAQEPQPVAVDEATLLELIKNQRLSTDNVRWGNVQLQFDANGGLYGTASGGSDSGKWRIAEGKLCLQWRRWDYEGCGAVEKIGDNRYRHLWPNGNPHFTFSR